MLINFAVFYLIVGLYFISLQIFFSAKEGYLKQLTDGEFAAGCAVGIFAWPLLVYEWIRLYG